MGTELPVQIAVVGVGLIGPRHAQSIAACGDAELLCLVDPSPTAKAVADSFRVPLFTTIRAMLAEGYKPEAAIVCTPNKTHAALAKELLAAGVHVLVEKPITTVVQDGKNLLEVSEQSGKRLLVGHHRRFNPYITATKAALSEGVIGRPIAISGLWTLCKPPTYFQPPSEWRAKHDGGGVILINLIHEVDILQYLFGPITRVHAEQTASQRGHEAEEGAAIILCFQCGLVGTFLIVDAVPSAHNFESATGENPTIPKAGKDIYRIFGTNGTLSVGDMVVTTHEKDLEKSWSSKLQESYISVGKEIPFHEQVKNLVEVVRGREEPRCSGKDGVSAMIVCDSVRTALATGKSVNIQA